MDNPAIVTQQPGAPPQYPTPDQMQAGYPQMQAAGYPQMQAAGYPQMQAQYPQGYAPQPYPSAQQTTETNVNVVIQQQPTRKQERQWSSGLCACCDDIGVCLCGMFCCYNWMLTDVSQRMGEGCCFPCCCPGALLGLRIKLRVQENIQGSLMGDYCLVQWCPMLVLCQLSRELKKIGR